MARQSVWLMMNIERIVSDKYLLAHILDKRVAFIPDDIWEVMGLP